jgi:cell division septation protein DedD
VTTDEGFREIQLNGKQLVFLFMAATVVSVVIFLCGVLVGRGVRPDRPAEAETASAAVVPDAASALPPQPSATPAQPPAEPPAPAEELTYFDRLQKNDTPRETLKPSSPAPNVAPAQAPRAASPAVSAPQPKSVVAHPPSRSAGEPPGPGFAVQVSTRPDRQAADTLANQLIKKGYPAYVSGPVPSGGRSIFRIRVGKYKTFKEADAIKTRLEVEEKFKGWVAQ